MRMYFYLFEDGSTCQKQHTVEGEILQEDIDSIDQGTLDIYRFEPDRGFCRALVGPSEDDEEVLEIADWEMVERR